MIWCPTTGEAQLDGERLVELMLSIERRLRGGGGRQGGYGRAVSWRGWEDGASMKGRNISRRRLLDIGCEVESVGSA